MIVVDRPPADPSKAQDRRGARAPCRGRVRYHLAMEERAGPATVRPATGALTDHEGVTRPVADGEDACAAVAIEDAVPSARIERDSRGTEHGDIVGGGQL